jgi:hypothetical protein
MLFFLGAAAWCSESPTGLPAPSPDQLQALVLQHFASLPDYEAGDLITQSATAKLFQKMEQQGWMVADGSELLERVLPEDDILVQQMRTKKGRKFWSKICTLPGGIDRLDRLARMPQGEANVRDLIQKIPDGDKWIEGMTTTRRGQRMGERLSRSPGNRDFNKPTKRIYTAEILLQELNGRVSVVPAP